MTTNIVMCQDELKDFDWLVNATVLDQWELAELLCDYINTHKWFLQENIPFSVSFTQAVFSYFENVYRPMMEAMKSTLLIDTVRGNGPGLFGLIKTVSDTHFFKNEKSKVYFPYEEVCKHILKETKGHWLTKLRSVVLSR